MMPVSKPLFLMSLLSLPRLNQDNSSILRTSEQQMVHERSQGSANTQINPRSEPGCNHKMAIATICYLIKKLHMLTI